MIQKSSIKTIVMLLFIIPLGLLFFAWVSSIYFVDLDSDEADVYYDLLTDNADPADVIMLNTGVGVNAGLKPEVDRMKNIMGLGKYQMALDFHEDDMPPAKIQNDNWNLTIYFSRHITEKREQLGLLAHELSHVYVWGIDDALIEGKDEEKLVDTTAIYLGMGVLMLNGLTDDVVFTPGNEYSARKRFFGYLKPEQLGYILARHCAENDILEDNILMFLGPAGQKYFNIGNGYLAREKIEVNKTGKSIKGAYWCSKCGKYMEIPLNKKITSLKCPACSWEPKNLFSNRPLFTSAAVNNVLARFDINTDGVMGGLVKIDRSAFDFINRKMGNPFYDKIIDLFKGIPGEAVIILAGIILIILGSKNMKYTSLIVIASYEAARFLFKFLDRYFQRPRPAEVLDGVRSLVSPFAGASGYIASFFAVSTVVIMRYPLTRFIVLSAMVLVALSGPYTGIYYPSDVLSGGLIGIIIGYMLTNVVDREKVSRKKKKR